MSHGAAGALGLILLWVAFAAFFVAFHPGGLKIGDRAAQNPQDVILWFIRRAAQGAPSSDSGGTQTA